MGSSYFFDNFDSSRLMQLFLNTTSPFARVVRVVALEKGLADQLTLVSADPWNHDPALLAVHPQLRIPVLITPEGSAIAESLLIAQYLDMVGTGPALVPAAHAAAVLARTSVAYGLMEAAFHVVIGRKYEGEQTDTSVMGQRRLASIGRVLQQLESASPTPLADHATLDTITTAVALDYVRFRLPALFATQAYPQLHQWLNQAQQQPHLAHTRFA
jgi:glutathione S-transferase